MKLDIKYWLRYSIFNLLIVGALGVLMRYKIGFEFPFFSQKNIQHAHSHFAFVGWITHTLYVLMLDFLQSKTTLSYSKKFHSIIKANLLCAYGMLISFAIQGYGAFSIAFSVATIVLACLYGFCFFKDLKSVEKNNSSINWFKAALWFNILSSIGTFYLAYMMATKNFNEHLYLAAVYFYLHFQYNGFFIFACMGLFYWKASTIQPTFTFNKTIFKLFLISFIPAYFLSILWINIPTWLYVIVVVAALLQLYVWANVLIALRKSDFLKRTEHTITNYFLLFVAIAFSIKLLLQLGSTIPFVSTLAFGFRPIVIAYLHLVLLAVISVFLLTYIYSSNLITQTKLSLWALVIFAAGVFLNEVVLAIQGIASFGYIAIANINYVLFAVALMLLAALIMLAISQLKSAIEE